MPTPRPRSAMRGAPGAENVAPSDAGPALKVRERSRPGHGRGSWRPAPPPALGVSPRAFAHHAPPPPAQPPPAAAAPAPPPKRKRARALAPASGLEDPAALAARARPPPVVPDGDTEYERERAARIARNREMLDALAVREAARAVAAVSAAGPPRARPRPRALRGPRAAAAAPAPTRLSSRARGLAPDAAALPDDEGGEARGREELLECDAFWAERGGNPCANPIVSDGRYKG